MKYIIPLISLAILSGCSSLGLSEAEKSALAQSNKIMRSFSTQCGGDLFIQFPWRGVMANGRDVTDIWVKDYSDGYQSLVESTDLSDADALNTGNVKEIDIFYSLKPGRRLTKDFGDNSSQWSQDDFEAMKSTTNEHGMKIVSGDPLIKFVYYVKKDGGVALGDIYKSSGFGVVDGASYQGYLTGKYFLTCDDVKTAMRGTAPVAAHDAAPPLDAASAAVPAQEAGDALAGVAPSAGDGKEH